MQEADGVGSDLGNPNAIPNYAEWPTFGSEQQGRKPSSDPVSGARGHSMHSHQIDLSYLFGLPRGAGRPAGAQQAQGADGPGIDGLVAPVDEEMDDATLIQRLDDLFRFFMGNASEFQGTPDWHVMSKYRAFFGIDSDDVIIMDPAIYEQFRHRIEMIRDLGMLLTNRGLALEQSSNPDIVERRRQLDQILMSVTHGYASIAHLARARDHNDPSRRPAILPFPMDLMASIWEDAHGKKRKYTDRQAYILFMLEYVHRNRLAKDERGDAYHAEIMTPEHLRTPAWERRGDLSELVYRAIRPRDANAEAWRCLTHSPGTVRSVVEYLGGCVDAEFRVVRKGRRTWAFRNGVYMGDCGAFLEWDHPRLTEGVAACKYFEQPFENTQYVNEMRQRTEAGDWRDIRTDEIDKIMDDQKLPVSVQMWIYILFGRLAYEVNEYDFWQVQLFLKGVAGTGKSTLLNLLRNLWDPTDVGTVSNSTERNFPLEALLHVFVFFGMDVSNQLSLDQTLWQSMVSGEGIAVNCKFKTARSVIWRIPGIWAGNQTPPWKDNAGSVSRRMLIAAFLETIAEMAVRGDLDEQLRLKIGAFIKKITLAYGDVGFHRGRYGIWDMLPPYFRRTRKMLREETNLLEAFLASGQVEVKEGLLCPALDFQLAFRLFCLGKDMRVPHWEPGYYTKPFQGQTPQIYPAAKSTRMYHQRSMTTDWLINVDLSHVLDAERTRKNVLRSDIGRRQDVAVQVVNAMAAAAAASGAAGAAAASGAAAGAAAASGAAAGAAAAGAIRVAGGPMGAGASRPAAGLGPGSVAPAVPGSVAASASGGQASVAR